MWPTNYVASTKVSNKQLVKMKCQVPGCTFDTDILGKEATAEQQLEALQIHRADAHPNRQQPPKQKPGLKSFPARGWRSRMALCQRRPGTILPTVGKSTRRI